MEHLINPLVREIQISGIRKISNLVSTIPGALTLTIGQPDFPTPRHIIEAGQRALDQNKTVYTQNPGLLELREAVANFVHVKYGQTYRPADEIIVTAGASQAVDITLRTILTPGAEVIIPAPIYPGYEPLIRLAGGIPVYVDTRDNGLKLTADLLEPYLTDKTRCVILCYPSNPTGQVLSEKELADLAQLLADRELFILSDEIYSELVYGQQHHSISTLGKLREKTIVINGLSKSHAMTGWRIGFTLAPAYLTEHMTKVHQYNVTCASSVSQYAALEALTVGVDDALPMRSAYEARRDYVYDRLVAMGIELEKPDGAFYLFPSIAKFGLSSMDFTMKLLQDEHVAVVPGDAFTSFGEGFIRISYAYSQEVLEESLNRLERFVGKLR
ncbi:aminotransferase A [Paenibacillus sp. HWE-109]|uniref:aminotransferase A n=1 Tax=Paenibacillus sp. HWE-109 TaxID=1306526 RepID=UPI001EE11C69|nr:aminotransferase A [Paenibacillus sp. HWE-109]UKS30255.1 aminotransferase A [Paenibacillus sp. HWE-109]